MAGADIILCYMDNGAMTCADSWVPSAYESMPLPDYYFGHTDDIAPGSVSGQILGGALTARFSRKCNTGDSVDHIITNSMAPMIFAHGPTAHPAQHGLFGRAQGTINLFTNEAVLDGEDVFHLGSASSSTFAAVGFILLALQGSYFDLDICIGTNDVASQLLRCCSFLYFGRHVMYSSRARHWS